MDPEGKLRVILGQLAREIGDSKDFRSTVETLLKVHRNILQNQGNEKYNVLKLTNSSVSNIRKFKAARIFLKEVGWFEDANCIRFAGDKLQVALNVLTEYRLIAPSENEWSPENKIEDLKKSETEENKKRASAAKQRDKELAEFFKDKQEREKIAADIKRKIRSDQEHRRNTPRAPLLPKSKSKSRPIVGPTNAFNTPGHSLSDPALSDPSFAVHGQGIGRK